MRCCDEFPDITAEPEEREGVAAVVVGLRGLGARHTRVAREVLAHRVFQRAGAVIVQHEAERL